MPVTISGGSFGSTLSSRPDTRSDQQAIAKADLNKLKNQIAANELKKGSKAVRDELNRLEKMGIATFGTGLRGMFDVAGSGDKPYTRSQISRLRGALYDPSQRDFSQESQVAGQELTADDYEDYLAGREDRYKDSAFAKGIATLANIFNPASLATGALSAARTYGGKYLPEFLKEQRVPYANLLKYAPRPDISNQFAGIASLPLNVSQQPPSSVIPIAPLMDSFQTASNEFQPKPAIVQTKYDLVNKPVLYPTLKPNLDTFV